MIPAPLATNTVALLLGANLGLLGAICILLTYLFAVLMDCRALLRALKAMHHDAIAKLLVIRGATCVGPVDQDQIEGEANRRVA